MPVGRGLGTYQCQQETWRLNFLWCFTFYRTTSKIVFFFFGEEGDNFFFWLLQHPHFFRETSNQHPHFFRRCSSSGSTLESRIMQVKEKHKYQPQNVIRFHLQGCSCVLKRPPTLPTSKDSHCNDKRFGNLPPSFRSLAFFLLGVWHL